MGDYEGSTIVDLPRDDLFEYLSKIENLPAYMARMTEAHALPGDEVSVEARIEPGDAGTDGASGDGTSAGDGPDADGGGRTVRGEAWFRIDADGRRLEWGSEGPNDYRGELAVSSDGEGASRVVVRLHTLHDDAAGIEQGLTETLENIERLSPSDLG